MVRKTTRVRRSKRRVIDVDVGYDKMTKAIRELKKGFTIHVGYPEERGIPQDIVAKAFLNEFGTQKIPERSFLRSTMDENLKKYQAGLGEATQGALMAEVLFGKNFQSVLKKNMRNLARKGVTDVKTTIKNLKTPANAPSTIRNKGFNNPLIDSGDMRRFVNYILINTKGVAQE